MGSGSSLVACRWRGGGAGPARAPAQRWLGGDDAGGRAPRTTRRARAPRVSYVRCATPMNRQSTTSSWLVRRRHRRRAQLALARGGRGQDVVGVLRRSRPSGRPVIAIVVAPRSKATRSGSMTSAGRPGVGDRDRDVTGAQLHRVGHGQVRVAVGVGDQPDAQQLLGEVLGDQTGRPDAVHIDAAGGGERGDGGAELDGVEPGGGVGEGLLLVVGELRDDVGDRVVDRDVRGDGRGPAGLLLGGERRRGRGAGRGSRGSRAAGRCGRRSPRWCR